jgi:predicted AAA+ superfamily ATPase
MVLRSIKPLISRSFFLFGARGSGKSTWLRKQFQSEDALYVNLLDPDIYETLSLKPSKFSEWIQAKDHINKTIVVDEIQKIPALLNIIHDQISHSKRVFVLTGSSARRLKQKGTNLMAGRASVYYLYPFSMSELKDDFNLQKCLERGLLPDSYFAKSDEEFREYLKSYVLTYIEKEIQLEQWVRKIEPFRKFLNIAVQMNSKIINKAKIARQVGVDSSTIESYLEILEDTLLAFRIPGFETSIRRQVTLADKVYFIDTGIVRAIDKTLAIPLNEHNSSYGSLFETFIVMEIKKIIEYNRLDWTLSYVKTKEDVEIDLVITRPRKSPLLIEIKSTDSLMHEDAKSLISLGSDLDQLYKQKCPKMIISQDKFSKEVSGVENCFYINLEKRLLTFL